MTVLLMGCGGSAGPVSASTTAAGAGINARLPAIFKILPGERLTPRAVYAPANIPIELVLISRDGRAHHATLRTAKPRSLAVSPGGRAERLIPGLPAGTYRLYVDGAPRAALRVGFGPGP